MKDWNTVSADASDDRADPAARETIQKLVLRAQGGSNEAHQALRARYRPLLDASVARFSASGLSRQELEDLREEAERVFLCAISSYDTEQDAVDFGLYAKICISNGLISEWRRMEAHRRHGTLPLPEEPEVMDDPAARLVEEERFRHLCETVRSLLSDYENRVWWQYVTGVSVADIARQTGKDERSVHNAIYRIRRKLRTHLTST